MQSNSPERIENLFPYFEFPVLIVSTLVGKGIYSIGEAIQESFERIGAGKKEVSHISIEECISESIYHEDVVRYRLIATYFPFLLHLIYRAPFIYYRKYLREQFFDNKGLEKLSEVISRFCPKTILCVSHRPAFWVSNLKRKAEIDSKIWGVLCEFGRSYGWKYIFWKEMEGLLSPVRWEDLRGFLPATPYFHHIDLPCKQEYRALAKLPINRNHVLVSGGYWGLSSVYELVRELLSFSDDREGPLQISVSTGDNEKSFRKLKNEYGENKRIQIYSKLPSLASVLGTCGAVITKPGISTLIEAHAARRKIFLVKGLPVAEDNNARYAIKNFSAEWYSKESFRRWFERRD